VRRRETKQGRPYVEYVGPALSAASEGPGDSRVVSSA